MKIVPFWSKTVNSCGLGSVGLGPSFKTPLCLISLDILSSPSATIFPWVVNREVLPELRKPIRQVNWLSESVNTFRPFTLHTESNIYIDRSRNKGGRVVFVSLCGSPSAVPTTWNTKASDSNQDEGVNAWKQTLLFGAQASWLLSNAPCSKSSNFLQEQMLQS